MEAYAQQFQPANLVLDTAITRTNQTRNDLLHPTALPNYAVAAADTIATSLVALGTAFQYTPESFAPQSWERYHRSRQGYALPSDIAGLFFAAGAGMKAARLGSSVNKVVDQAGASTRLQQMLFADVDRTRELDNIVDTARHNLATGIAAHAATVAPDLRMQQVVGETVVEGGLARAGETFTDIAARSQALKMSNAVKEAVGAEIAVFSMYNSSDFLFPDEAPMWQHLTFAGLGVGLSVGVEALVARAATRKSMARAAQAGAEVAQARQSNLVTEARAVKGIVGEQWQGAVASLYGMQRIDNAIESVDQIVKESNGLLSRELVTDSLQQARLSYQDTLQDQVKDIFNRAVKNGPVGIGYAKVPKVTQENAARGGALGEALTRIKSNDQIAIGLADMGDAEYVVRYENLSQRLDADITSLQRELNSAIRNKLPKDEVDEIRTRLKTTSDEFQKLDNYRAATIEQNGRVNYSPTRRAPYWEYAKANAARRTKAGLRVESVSSTMRPLNLKASGRLFTDAGEEIIPTDLNFEEATAVYSLVRDLGESQSEVNRFWQNIGEADEFNWRNLPFPVLDGINSGTIPFSDLRSASIHEEALKMAARNGQLTRHTLAQKLDWYAKQKHNFSIGEAPLGVMDAEKALNMQLTDKSGMPNTLYHALEAYLDAGDSLSAKDLLRLDQPYGSEGFENIFDLGLGYQQKFTPEIRRQQMQEFTESLSSGGSFEGRLDKRGKPRIGGIGALYHKIDVPNEGERQLAKLIDRRNNIRLETMMNDSPSFMGELMQRILSDEVAYVGSRNVAGVVASHEIRNNLLAQTTWKHRYNKAIGHAHAVGQSALKQIEDYMNARLKPIANVVQDLYKSGNWASVGPQLSAAQHLVSRGFSLLPGMQYTIGRNAIDVTRPGAKNVIKTLGELEGAPQSWDDWELFDISIAANEGRYVPIELTEEAASLLNMYNDVSREQLEVINTLRKQAGVPALPELFGHLPVTDFSRYHLRYIQDAETQQVVGYVKGKTAREADRLLQEAIKREQALGNRGVLEITQDQIRSHYDAVDEVFLNQLSDFSGIRQRGTTQGRNMDFRLDITADLPEEMMVAMRNTYIDLKDRTLAAVYADTIFEANTLQKRMGYKIDEANVVNNPLQVWKDLLLARPSVPKDSFARRTHGLLTDMANAAVGIFADNVGHAMTVASKLLDAPGEAEKMANPKQIEAIKQVVENYAPFSRMMENPDVAKYLKTEADVDPYRLSRALQMANRATTYLALKWGNLAHPILNYLGTVVTSPAVLHHLKRLPSETIEDWKVRVGPMADYIGDEGIATINPTKLMSMAWERAMNDGDTIEFARSLGYLEANMLEELHALNNIRPSKFVEAIEQFAARTDVINNMVNYGMKSRGIQPSAETMSERSETATRLWLHMAGLEIAQRGNPNLSQEAMHAFAHQFANQNIADFAPNIRGQAFQGLAGIPFGLFQSYAINLLQRLFGYVENKQTRTMLTQTFTQTAVFGASGLPGWSAINALYYPQKDINADENNATTLNERLYGALGKDLADVLMTGGPSSLPKLAMLLPGEQGSVTGLNLYSSGDMNPRVPNVPPAVSFTQQTLQGLRESLTVARQEIPKLFNEQDADLLDRQLEVVANYAPARGMRSIAELALGERIDRNGNLIVEDTRRGVALLARMIGTRTQDERMVQTAMWHNSTSQRQRIEDLDKVRDQMLRHIREGTMDEQELTHYLVQYLSRGGNYDSWNRWLEYTRDKATGTRGDRALDKITSEVGEIIYHNASRAQRLINAGVQDLPADVQLRRAEQAAIGGTELPSAEMAGM